VGIVWKRKFCGSSVAFAVPWSGAGKGNVITGLPPSVVSVALAPASRAALITPCGSVQT
jgi:hypothetical protein